MSNKKETTVKMMERMSKTYFFRGDIESFEFWKKQSIKLKDELKSKGKTK
jgi:hypothetical protein